MEWIIEKRRDPSVKDIFTGIKLEYKKQRERSDLVELLSKTDFAILDSVLLDDRQGANYDHLSFVESCLKFNIASSMHFFTHMQTSRRQLAFDYLDNGTTLCKVVYKFVEDLISIHPRWTLEMTEKHLFLESPWYKPYLADLPKLSLGIEYIAFIKNYLFFIKESTKRAIYNFKLTGMSSIARFLPFSDSYFLVQISTGPKILMKVFSRKTRKSILTLNCFGAPSKTPTSSSCQMTTLKRFGKVIVFWNTLTNSFDIYSVLWRRFICSTNLPVTVKGLAYFYVQDQSILIAANNFIHIFDLISNAHEVKAVLKAQCPNMLERKCWWDRSIVLSEEVCFSSAGSHTLAYSKGKTIGMQVMSTKTGTTSFVRLFDQPAGNLLSTSDQQDRVKSRPSLCLLPAERGRSDIP